MNKFSLFVISASLALPAGAQAQQRLNQEQLIAWATEQEACGEDRTVASARYVNETDNSVEVTCDGAGGLANSGVAIAVLVGLAAAAAAAGGGGGSTPDTQ